MVLLLIRCHPRLRFPVIPFHFTHCSSESELSEGFSLHKSIPPPLFLLLKSHGLPSQSHTAPLFFSLTQIQIQSPPSIVPNFLILFPLLPLLRTTSIPLFLVQTIILHQSLLLSKRPCVSQAHQKHPFPFPTQLSPSPKPSLLPRRGNHVHRHRRNRVLLHALPPQPRHRSPAHGVSCHRRIGNRRGGRGGEGHRGAVEQPPRRHRSPTRPHGAQN